MRFGKKLLLVCAFAGIPATASAISDKSPVFQTGFAYPISHSFAPLPDVVIDRIANPDIASWETIDFDGWVTIALKPVDIRIGPPRTMSRDSVCGAIVSVARTYDLPVPFFANLIWQESSFNAKTISRAGAQGIAQFMPQTAVGYGLIKDRKSTRLNSSH